MGISNTSDDDNENVDGRGSTVVGDNGGVPVLVVGASLLSTVPSSRPSTIIAVGGGSGMVGAESPVSNVSLIETIRSPSF